MRGPSQGFWIVWNPQGTTPPRYQHRSFEAASVEAERLAQANPGKDFYVMAAKRRVRTLKPVEIEDFEELDLSGDVPF